MLKQARSRAAPTPIRELGPHPDDGETVAIFDGRYGPYVKHGKINATIPKDREVEHVRLEEALDWIAEKAAKKGMRRGGNKKAAKKKGAKKEASASAAKKTNKKPATKKKASKKKAKRKKHPE